MSNGTGPSDAAEYNRLFDDLPGAIKRAREILKVSGIISPAFLAAEMEVSRILTRINELATGHVLGAAEDNVSAVE
jgi:hypothetical protein